VRPKRRRIEDGWEDGEASWKFVSSFGIRLHIRGILGKSWKEAGLGLLNLVAIILMVLATQPLFRKYLPDTVGGALLALLVVTTYVAASKWIERRSPSELTPPGKRRVIRSSETIAKITRRSKSRLPIYTNLDRLHRASDNLRVLGGQVAASAHHHAGRSC